MPHNPPTLPPELLPLIVQHYLTHTLQTLFRDLRPRNPYERHLNTQGALFKYHAQMKRIMYVGDYFEDMALKAMDQHATQLKRLADARYREAALFISGIVEKERGWATRAIDEGHQRQLDWEEEQRWVKREGAKPEKRKAELMRYIASRAQRFQ